MINNFLKVASGSMSSIASMSSKAGEATSSNVKKFLGASVVIGAIGTAVYKYSSLTQEERTKIFEALKEKVSPKKPEEKPSGAKASIPTSSGVLSKAPETVLTSASVGADGATSAPKDQPKPQESKSQENKAVSTPPSSTRSDDKVTTSYFGRWNPGWNTKTVVTVSAVSVIGLAFVAATFSGR